MKDKKKRLENVINLSWDIFFNSIISSRIKINLEASMQLYLSNIILKLGEAMCLEPGEVFKVELETNYNKKKIDITCSFESPYEKSSAAIELKCYKKASNRPIDVDMYDILKDIERLQNYKGFDLKYFICLTDNINYKNGNHKGHASCVSVRDGAIFNKNEELTPSWVGRWKDKSKDDPIIFNENVKIKWFSEEDWHFLKLNL